MENRSIMKITKKDGFYTLLHYEIFIFFTSYKHEFGSITLLDKGIEIAIIFPGMIKEFEKKIKEVEA